MRRDRPVPLLLTCVLALATGVALLGTATIVTAPAPNARADAAAGDTETPGVDVVRRFYAAVNTTLRTGDPAPVVALLAPDFVERGGPPGLAPNRDGLVRHLLALREVFPSLWIDAEEVLTQGDWILARVSAEGTAHGQFLGVPLSGMAATWSGLDVYRIAGSRIVERWGAGEWPVLPQPLVQAPLAKPPSAALLRLARFTYAPAARQPQASTLGPLLVAVEVAALTVQVEGQALVTRAATAGSSGPSEAIVPPGTEIELRSGDGLMLSSGTPATFRNAGPTPAIALALTLLPWNAGAPDGTLFHWPETGSPDVAAQLLAEGAVDALPAGPVTLALGRVTLATPAELPAGDAMSSRLVAVEEGSLQLAVVAEPPTALSPGQGALIPPGVGATLGSARDGPVVILLATITSAAAETANLGRGETNSGD